MERRFVIREWGEGDPNPGWTVTESELKRRLAYIAGWPIEEMGSMDRDIDILIHGEGEKVEERKYPCADCGKLLTAAEGGSTFTVCDECWDKGRAVPTQSPTREEWEAWVNKMPRDMLTGDWFLKMRAWFLSMPCVPKGNPPQAG